VWEPPRNHFSAKSRLVGHSRSRTSRRCKLHTISVLFGLRRWRLLPMDAGAPRQHAQPCHPEPDRARRRHAASL